MTKDEEALDTLMRTARRVAKRSPAYGRLLKMKVHELRAMVRMATKAGATAPRLTRRKYEEGLDTPKLQIPGRQYKE